MLAFTFTAFRYCYTYRLPSWCSGREQFSGGRRHRSRDLDTLRKQEKRGSDTYSSDGSPCEKYSEPRRSRNPERPHSSDNPENDRQQMGASWPDSSSPEKSRRKKSREKSRNSSRSKSVSPTRKTPIKVEDPR